MMAQALYRPTNASEGDVFMGVWCARCERDRGHRENPETSDGCPILIATLGYSINHPDYPAAWVVVDGKAICSEFEACDADNVPLDPNAVVRPLL